MSEDHSPDIGIEMDRENNFGFGDMADDASYSLANSFHPLTKTFAAVSRDQD